MNSVSHSIFPSTLIQFWRYLHEVPVFKGILSHLACRGTSSQSTATNIVQDGAALLGTDELESAAIAYFVIKECVEGQVGNRVLKIGRAYKRSGDLEESLDQFREIFLEPLYEYIDEQIDDQRAILHLLLRYKHRCEWFYRTSLFELWQEDTRLGEKRLALDMYAWLHDQGLDFLIEPSSISGKADLIAAQNTPDPLIADAKVFNPAKSHGKAYIAKGFHQIYIYTCDFNEPFGYLIIFKTSEHDVRFALGNQPDLVPYLVHNDKTIFLILIDIFPHAEPASKRGKLQPVEITLADLVQLATEAPEADVNDDAGGPDDNAAELT